MDLNWIPVSYFLPLNAQQPDDLTCQVISGLAPIDVSKISILWSARCRTAVAPLWVGSSSWRGYEELRRPHKTLIFQSMQCSHTACTLYKRLKKNPGYGWTPTLVVAPLCSPTIQAGAFHRPGRGWAAFNTVFEFGQVTHRICQMCYTNKISIFQFYTFYLIGKGFMPFSGLQMIQWCFCDLLGKFHVWFLSLNMTTTKNRLDC